MRRFLFLSAVLFLSACGGSSSDLPNIVVESPAADQQFSAGATITLKVRTENFTLMVPPDREGGEVPYVGSLKSLAKTDGGHGHAEEHSAHGHSSSETSPHAREGHMHIYLNDAAGSDVHVTTWSEETPVTLPDDLHHGVHTLRFELRDNHHTIVNSNFDQVYFFEVVE